MYSKKLKFEISSLNVKMSSNLVIWFRSLLRPKMVSVRVILYENGNIQDIHKFDSQKRTEIMKSIQKLWETPEGSSFWFEVEEIQKTTMCKTYPSVLYVSCYSHGQRDPSSKIPTNIPIRYRHKMMDRIHTLERTPVGVIPWPAKMQVKFKLLD